MSEDLDNLDDNKENIIPSKSNEKYKLLNNLDVKKNKLTNFSNIKKSSKSITKKFHKNNNLDDIKEDTTTKVKKDDKHNFSYYSNLKNFFEYNFLSNINSNLNEPQIITLNKLNDNLSIKRFNDNIFIDKNGSKLINKDYTNSFLFYNFYFLKKPIFYDWEDKIIYKKIYKELIKDSIKNTMIFKFFKKNWITINNDLYNFLMQASHKLISNSVFENINFKEFLDLINEVFKHVTYHDKKLLDTCIESIKLNYFTPDSGNNDKKTKIKD